MPTFPERLQAARALSHLTQREVARRLAAYGQMVGEGDISRLETGAVRNPGLERVAALARVLQCSTDYLLGLADEPQPVAAYEVRGGDWGGTDPGDEDVAEAVTRARRPPADQTQASPTPAPSPATPRRGRRPPQG